MSVIEVHENDIGTVFEVTLKDNGTVVNISGATVTKDIIFKKPDGTLVTQAASFTNTGTDGKLQYVSKSGDLTPTGKWELQAFIKIGGTDQWSSQKFEFQVHENL